MEQRANFIIHCINTYLFAYLKLFYQRISISIVKNANILIDCVAIEPLMLVYAFETRIMIAFIVLFFYGYICLHERVWNTIDINPILKRVAPLYFTLFLWFMLSKIWSGPSYAQDCIWLQPQIEWILFFTVLIENVVLFLPPEPLFDFLWMVNYVYPERSMISTCASWYELLARGAGMSLLWVLTDHKLRIRAIGLFLVNSWWGVIFFVIAWCIADIRSSNSIEKKIDV